MFLIIYLYLAFIFIYHTYIFWSALNLTMNQKHVSYISSVQDFFFQLPAILNLYLEFHSINLYCILKHVFRMYPIFSLI